MLVSDWPRLVPTVASTALRATLVRTEPGQTLVTRTPEPRACSSARRASKKPRSACLEPQSVRTGFEHWSTKCVHVCTSKDRGLNPSGDTGRAQRDAHLARDRRDVDQTPAAAAAHRRQQLLGEADARKVVDVGHMHVDFEGRVDAELALREARVVHQHVDACAATQRRHGERTGPPLK
eukprot:1206745-Prymnesium_polylepis.1